MHRDIDFYNITAWNELAHMVGLSKVVFLQDIDVWILNNQDYRVLHQVPTSWSTCWNTFEQKH